MGLRGKLQHPDYKATRLRGKLGLSTAHCSADTPCDPAYPFGLFLQSRNTCWRPTPWNFSSFTPPGTILAVQAGQFGGGLFRRPDAAAGVLCCGFWWSMAVVAPAMDPSYVMEVGGIVHLNTGELWMSEPPTHQPVNTLGGRTMHNHTVQTLDLWDAPKGRGWCLACRLLKKMLFVHPA